MITNWWESLKKGRLSIFCGSTPK